jgi:hypothetical protein
MRVVISMTTIAGREHLLVKALESLSHQTWWPDAIYLWIPDGQMDISSLARDYPRVKILVGPDQGPAMKLLPTLALETDPATRIITIDDDIEYPPGFVDKLARSSALLPGHAIGFTGWSLVGGSSVSASIAHMNDSFPNCAFYQPVQVLEGFLGIIYRRGFFAEDIHYHAKALHAFRYHDDILFSGYLASRGIVRTVRWYDACPQPGISHWNIHCQESGLHTTSNWYQLGLESWNYWAGGNNEGIGPPFTEMSSGQRLRIIGADCLDYGCSRPSFGITYAESEIRISLDSIPWPLPDNHFEEVVAQGFPANMYLPIRAFLSESLRVLKPGGVLMIILPKHPALCAFTGRDAGLHLDANSFCDILQDISCAASMVVAPVYRPLPEVKISLEIENDKLCVSLVAPLWRSV